nr:head-tail adaptor protein [uncultured Shinella sp.]
MTGAGNLRELVNMQTRTMVDDGFGNEQAGPFETQWSGPARIQILRGTETVMAGRLTGVKTFAITMRWQAEFNTINASWRMVNDRTGEIYDITSIEPDERSAFVNILAKTGN